MKTQSEVGRTVKSLFRTLDSGFDLDSDQKQRWLKKQDTEADYLLPVGSAAFDAEEFVKLAAPHTMTCPLTADEKLALYKSIAAHGITEDVIMDVTGRIIDGFHRVLIACQILLAESRAVNVPYKIVEFNDAAAEAEFVTIRHAVRRQLTTAQRVAMAEGLLRAGHAGTNAYIGLMVGLSENTIKKYRIALENGEEITVLTTTVDKRGRTHKRRTKQPRSNTHKVVQMDLVDEAEVADDIGLIPNETSVETSLDKNRSDNLADETPVLPVQDVPILKSTPRSEAVTELPEEAPKDGFLNPMLNAWWKDRGIEPVTCTEIAAVVRKAGISDEALLELTANPKKLGTYLGKVVDSEVFGFLVQGRVVSSAKIYFLRPTAWTKHGPR